MHAKLGLSENTEASRALVDDVLGLLRDQRVDFTSFFRALRRGEARTMFSDPAPFDAWEARWRATGPALEAMDAVNPVYIPRNHLVEEALAAATAGDLDPFRRLLGAVTSPFDERPGLERYAEPAPDEFGAGFRTFCGT